MQGILRVGEFCRTFCALVYNHVSQDLRYPLDINLDIVSDLKDAVEGVVNFGSKVLPCCWFGGDAFADGCLVVSKDPNGVCVCVVDHPHPGITGCLQGTKGLGIVYFNMISLASEW